MRKFWGKHFLRLELLTVCLASGLFVYWCERRGGYASVATLLEGNRSAVYGTAASILGALLGFAMTSVSIVVAFTGNKRLRVVTESSSFGTLWGTLTSTIRFLALATAACLVALFVDRERAPTPFAFYVVLILLSISVARLARSIWVLENLIRIVTTKVEA